LLRGTALGLLLRTITPEPLNVGETESLATTVPRPYGKLKGTLPPDFQAHHLNQNAVYQSAIPKDEGLSVGTRGNAITEPGTPHHEFHRVMEEFWEPYRSNQELFGTRPTNAMYGRALEEALVSSGRSPEEARYLARQAAEQRVSKGLLESQSVPRIPRRMSQAVSGEQRLQERLEETSPVDTQSDQSDSSR
jgi:hypothetical protein